MLCIYWPISKMLLTLWGDAIMAPLSPLPSSVPQSAPVLGGSNISLGRAAEFALPFRLPPKNYFLVKTSKVPASSEQTPRECGRVVSSRGAAGEPIPVEWLHCLNNGPASASCLSRGVLGVSGSAMIWLNPALQIPGALNGREGVGVGWTLRLE